MIEPNTQKRLKIPLLNFLKARKEQKRDCIRCPSVMYKSAGYAKLKLYCFLEKTEKGIEVKE